MSSKPLIYLASPYSGHNSQLEEARFQDVRLLTARLLQRGIRCFSPIVYSHQFSCEFSGFKSDFDSWRFLDEALIRKCDEVWCLKLPGWGTSVGVRAELMFARQCGKPVAYLEDANDQQPEYEVM